MENCIRLYRGDATRIEEFSFRKTLKHCLVGQGIYLTDSLKIAESYRIKGSREKYPFDIRVKTKTKNEAMSLAFTQYCKYRKEKEKILEQEFKLKLENNIIQIEREGFYMGRNTEWTFHIFEKVQIGYISVFEFPEPYFTRNCINIDAHYPDKELIRIVKENNLWKDKNIQRLDNIHFNKLIPILKDYGIHGFEYKGGRIGGGIKHRAFSIWDEEFVNSHMINRYK